MSETAAFNLKSKIQNPRSFIVPALIVCLSVVYKLFLLAFNAVPFNGDEAIVALMARHILRGERPVFFYGQAYLGATDAWLVALSFSIFGETVLAIRVVHIAVVCRRGVHDVSAGPALCAERMGRARGDAVDGAAADDADAVHDGDAGRLY